MNCCQHVYANLASTERSLLLLFIFSLCLYPFICMCVPLSLSLSPLSLCLFSLSVPLSLFLFESIYLSLSPPLPLSLSLSIGTISHRALFTSGARLRQVQNDESRSAGHDRQAGRCSCLVQVSLLYVAGVSIHHSTFDTPLSFSDLLRTDPTNNDAIYVKAICLFFQVKGVEKWAGGSRVLSWALPGFRIPQRRRASCCSGFSGRIQITPKLGMHSG